MRTIEALTTFDEMTLSEKKAFFDLRTSAPYVTAINLMQRARLAASEMLLDKHLGGESAEYWRGVVDGLEQFFALVEETGNSYARLSEEALWEQLRRDRRLPASLEELEEEFDENEDPTQAISDLGSSAL